MPTASAYSLTHRVCLWFPRCPQLPAPSFPSQPELLRVWVALPDSDSSSPTAACTHPPLCGHCPHQGHQHLLGSSQSSPASPRPWAVVQSPDTPPQLAGSLRASHLSGCSISTPLLASPPPSVPYVSLFLTLSWLPFLFRPLPLRDASWMAFLRHQKHLLLSKAIIAFPLTPAPATLSPD